MFTAPRAAWRALACAGVMLGACKDAKDEGVLTGGDASTHEPDAGEPNIGVDAGPGGGGSTVDPCGMMEGFSFTDDIALVGSAPFALLVDDEASHVAYLKTTCAGTGTTEVGGAGLVYLTFPHSGALPEAGQEVYANAPEECRATRDPVLASVDGKPHAYFFGDDPTMRVTAEVYGLEIGAEAATRLTQLPGEEVALTAVTLGGAPLLAWAGTVRGKPATIWTARGGMTAPYLFLPETRMHSPTRVDIAKLDDSTAVLVWSSTGEVEGVFMQVTDQLGEPVGALTQVSARSGEVDVAVHAVPDKQGYMGAIAYTVDGTLRFRRFDATGELEGNSRLISSANQMVSGISLASAFGTSYAAGYRSRVTRDGQVREVVQVSVADSQGTVAGHRVLAEVGTGVGPVRLQQTRDGRFVLAWADRTESGTKLHVQRALCQ